MRTLLTLIIILLSGCQIDREYKHLINTWELTHVNEIPHTATEPYQWSFKKDGTMIIAAGGVQEFNYDVIDYSICIHFDDTECFDILKLSKDNLLVHRLDADMIYTFKALN